MVAYVWKAEKSVALGLVGVYSQGMGYANKSATICTVFESRYFEYTRTPHVYSGDGADDHSVANSLKAHFALIACASRIFIQ